MGRLLPTVLFALCTGPLALADDTLSRGNRLITAQSWDECEAHFRAALDEEPDNPVYRSQLAHCLTQQGEYAEADSELERVLSAHPGTAGALWYRAVNRYHAGDHRASIEGFREVEPLLREGAPQLLALNFYVGSAYRQLLRTEGLAPEEIDAMVSALREYARLEPDAAVREQTVGWLAWVEENRPREGQAEIWIAPQRAPIRDAFDPAVEVEGDRVEEMELPDPAPGFIWKRLPELGAAFQMPKDWHFKRETKNGTEAFFMTKENIDELGYFRTGLTFNMIRNARERTGKPAAEYAEELAALACTKGQPLDSWRREAGVFGTFSCTVGSVPEGTPIVVHHMTVGNRRTDTLYIIVWETYAVSWQEEWEAVGAKMMELFVLDDEF